ncbi:MAG: LysE family translocator [Rhodospirillum sp.]|nr:LysE family translocator [Rhodospirillum sp.]MCF8488829.1 LysE family translocator [Rhodospirillum sp.]MCF8500911.1 LysE family translocator [Rhodospirillum sp.]
MSPEFLLTALVVVLAPGTGVLFTLATALSQGWRASVFAAIGCTLGILPHMIAAITGLAALLHASALAFQGIKVLGVLYLLYMAWMTLKERGALSVDAAEAPPRSMGRSVGQTVLAAFLLNILNPKLSIFFLAFLPQFVDAGDPTPLLSMVELSAVFMALTFVVFVGYGACAALVRDRVLARPRVLAWMRRAFAGAFLALGAKLALTER